MPFPERRPSAGQLPSHVEFIGLPGAGKSHIYHRLDWVRLGRAGAYRANEALLRALGSRHDLPRALRWGSTGARLARRYGAAPHLLRLSLARLTAELSIEAEEWSRRSLRAICEDVPPDRSPSWSAFSVLERLGAREAVESSTGARVVVWDEGLVQLGLHTVRAGVDTLDNAAVYAAAVWRPVALVLVDAPDPVILKRLSARNGTGRAAGPARAQGLELMIGELRKVLATMTEVLDRRGCRIIRVSGVEGAPDATERILRSVQGHSGGSHDPSVSDA